MCGLPRVVIIRDITSALCASEHAGAHKALYRSGSYLASLHPEGVRTKSPFIQQLHTCLVRTQLVLAPLEAAHLLLEACPEPATAQGRSGSLETHLACSVEVLLAILKQHPEGVRSHGCGGAAPLHCAMGSHEPELWVALCNQACPGALRAWGAEGKLPLHHSCKAGQSCLLTTEARALTEKRPEGCSRADAHGLLPLHSAL